MILAVRDFADEPVGRIRLLVPFHQQLDRRNVRSAQRGAALKFSFSTAMRMPALARDLRLISQGLAVWTAILLFIVENAATGRVGAFLCVGHRALHRAK